MDFGTIITGVIIIAICILPFILFGSGSRKRKKQLTQMLQSLAQKRQGHIAQHDFWANSAIALDDKAHYLYFIRKAGNEEIVEEVDLSGYQKCRAINLSRTVDKKNGNYKVIEKLQLQLSPSDKTHAEKVLEFYDFETDLQINWDAQLLEKWAKLINDKIGAYRPVKA